MELRGSHWRIPNSKEGDFGRIWVGGIIFVTWGRNGITIDHTDYTIDD